MSIYVYDKDYIKTKGEAIAVWVGALLPIILLVAILVWLCW